MRRPSFSPGRLEEHKSITQGYHTRVPSFQNILQIRNNLESRPAESVAAFTPDFHSGPALLLIPECLMYHVNDSVYLLTAFFCEWEDGGKDSHWNEMVALNIHHLSTEIVSFYNVELPKRNPWFCFGVVASIFPPRVLDSCEAGVDLWNSSAEYVLWLGFFGPCFRGSMAYCAVDDSSGLERIG